MRHSIVLLLLVVIGSAVPTLAAPGDLDPTFNTTGVVVTPVLTDPEATSVVHQLDGKIVVAGSALNGSTYDFVLVRYDTNGALDPSFGGTGIVTTAVGAGDDEVDALIQQTDDKLVVAGFSGTDIALVRYETNGTLDMSFNGTGKVTTPIVGTLIYST